MDYNVIQSVIGWRVCENEQYSNISKEFLVYQQS